MRIIDWSADVCSSELIAIIPVQACTGGKRHLAVGRKRLVEDCLKAAELRCCLWAEVEISDQRRTRRKRGGRIAVFVVKMAQGREDILLQTPAAPGEANVFKALDCLSTGRSEEHTSELQSLIRLSYAVF